MIRAKDKGNNRMIKLAMNQNTYNKLPNKDESTFYFIDNTLKDGEIKNCNNYLLSDEVAIIRKKIVELCKEQKVINCNIDGKEQVLKAYYHTHLGDKILELLDIQEVE